MQAILHLNSFDHRLPQYQVIRLQRTHHQLPRLLGLQAWQRRVMHPVGTWLLKLHGHLNWVVPAGGSRNLVFTELIRFQNLATTEYSDV